MSQVTLGDTIAIFNSHLITLRDDQERVSNLLKGDSLTTVMGPAVQAGVRGKSLIFRSLQANTPLRALTLECTVFLRS
jgi:hypothetical protein